MKRPPMPYYTDKPCYGSPFKVYDGAEGCLLIADGDTFGRAELSNERTKIRLTFKDEKGVIVIHPDLFWQEVSRGRARWQARRQMEWFSTHGKKLRRG